MKAEEKQTYIVRDGRGGYMSSYNKNHWGLNAFLWGLHCARSCKGTVYFRERPGAKEVFVKTYNPAILEKIKLEAKKAKKNKKDKKSKKDESVKTG